MQTHLDELDVQSGVSKNEPVGKQSLTTLINKTMMKASRQIPFLSLHDNKLAFHFLRDERRACYK